MSDDFQCLNFNAVIQTGHLTFVTMYTFLNISGNCTAFFLIPAPYILIARPDTTPASAAAVRIHGMSYTKLLSDMFKDHFPFSFLFS